MADQKKCIECGGAMHAIRVLDQANLDVHRQLEYSAVDARKGRWSGRFPWKATSLRSSAMVADTSSSALYHHSDNRTR